MNRKIKIILSLVFLFSCILKISNLKADDFEYLEDSNGVVCMPSEIGPIPVIWTGYKWTESDGKYSAAPTPLVKNLNHSFHCLAAWSENNFTGNKINSAYYYESINPTWRVYFPIIQNAIFDLGEESSAFKNKKMYIDLVDYDDDDGNNTDDRSNRYSIQLDVDTIKETINSIVNSTDFPNLKDSAKKECEKYCNKCHYIDNNYSYYCNDYNLKEGIHVVSPATYTGHNMVIGFGRTIQQAFRWTISGFDDEKGGLTRGWIKTIDSCKDTNCMGKIIRFNEIEYRMPGGKKCYNYISSKSRGYSYPENSSSVNDIDGWRYWVCESQADCNVSCYGRCISPSDYTKDSLATLNSMDSDVRGYVCIGTKIRNSKFLNGDSSEDFKYFTNDYSELTKMFKYDGDKIKASLGNIYKVGTGQITCEDVFSKDGNGSFSKILRDIFKYVRIAGVALFLIFTSLDFIKAISGSDEKPIKVVSKNLTKRFIVLLILLVLPTLINIILSIVEIKNGLCFLK